jgi:hypothetical protein
MGETTANQIGTYSHTSMKTAEDEIGMDLSFFFSRLF